MSCISKIMNGLDRPDPEIVPCQPKDVLSMPQSRLERIVQVWNSLSAMTVATTALNMFKSRFDK